MLWALLDVLIGVFAVLLVILLGYLLYKRVRVLMSAVGASSRQIGELTARLTVQPARREVR